jgi:RNA polymerase sigma-70 factor (ECF subfamily)
MGKTRPLAIHPGFENHGRGPWVTGDPVHVLGEVISGSNAKLGADRRTAEELFPAVYDELRRLAKRYMNRETPGHTLQPTALVHEAYLKLADQSRANWKSETHFISVGARIMRHLLVDHARGRAALKRGAAWRGVTLSGAFEPVGEKALDPEQLLDLNAALDQLAEVDEREAKIVTLRFFGGLTVKQVAEVLDVSSRTVENDWRHAKAWLSLKLSVANPL